MKTEIKDICSTQKKELTALTLLLFIRTVFYLPTIVAAKAEITGMSSAEVIVLMSLTVLLMALVDFICAVLTVYFYRRLPEEAMFLFAFFLAEPLLLANVCAPVHAAVFLIVIICLAWCMTSKKTNAKIWVLAACCMLVTFIMQSAVIAVVPMMLTVYSANELCHKRKISDILPVVFLCVGVSVLGAFLSRLAINNVSIWSWIYGHGVFLNQMKHSMSFMDINTIKQALVVYLKGLISGLPIHAMSAYVIFKAATGTYRKKIYPGRSSVIMLYLMPYIVCMIAVLFSSGTVFYSSLCMTPVLTALCLMFGGEQVTKGAVKSISSLFGKRPLLLVFSVVYLAGMCVYFNESFNQVFIYITTYQG